MKMVKRGTTSFVSLLLTTMMLVMGFSVSAQAALVDNGGGLIYDTDLNITWYDAPAVKRTWAAANTWAASLTLGNTAAGSWRLPTTPGTIGWEDPLPTYEGEMGHLYFAELHAPAYDPALNPSQYTPTSIAPFTTQFDTGGYIFLTGTEVEGISSLVWLFNFHGGIQEMNPKSFPYLALAVHEGNIGPNGPIAPVPIPAAAWLLGSGLMGLVGFRRKPSKA